MESFERHLSSGLTNRLGSNSSTSISRRHTCAFISRLNQSNKFVEHALSHLLEVLLSLFISFAELLVDVLNTFGDSSEEFEVTVLKFLADSKLLVALDD